MDPLGQLPESTCYEAHDSSQILGVELGLDWSDRVGWRAEHRIEVLGRGAVLPHDFDLPCVGNCGKLGCRCLGICIAWCEILPIEEGSGLVPEHILWLIVEFSSCAVGGLIFPMPYLRTRTRF